MTDVEQIRAFNRFYTRQIGLLDGMVPKEMSLTEARLLYEVGATEDLRARALAEQLGLDEGYVSRMLKRLQTVGLITRKVSSKDARAKSLALTKTGQSRHEEMVAKAEGAVGDMIAALDHPTRSLLLEAMSTIEGILGSPVAEDATLREMGTGDIGWLIKRYGELFATEGDFDMSFEALVARIVGGVFEEGAQPGGTGWVAVRNGARLGGIVYTQEDDTTGRLRTLIVEPSARGMGIGQRLVDRVIAHAQAQSMQKLVLWTEEGLDAAVRLYERTGFRMTGKSRDEAFGRVMHNQTWELDLTGGDQPRQS